MIDLICTVCRTPYKATATRAKRGSRYCSSPCRVKGVSEGNRRTLTERFWEKVDKRSPAECWPWKGGAFADGYGAISINGRPRRANRVCYEIIHGFVDPDLEVLHQCDNNHCVNPLHLKLGTHAENMADMGKRGRASQQYKLTDEQVQEVRNAVGTHAEIAAAFGVSKGLVSLIRGRAAHRVKKPVAMSKRKEMMILRTLSKI